ncbi:D-alanyl-D-alanine carboxypeptidase [Candidatus Uhrbacteria bacterium]|nr:D-alanyl-D-alanine carboxypeptidase [Candidatus Uhrbacteria bacterium]
MVVKTGIGFMMLFAVVCPTAIFAAPYPLEEIYQKRGDLQQAFDPDSHLAVSGTAAGFLLDLEDWATQYGWMEHEELASYGPEEGDGVPVRVNSEEIESEIGSEAYVVMDRSTGKILTVKNENKVWPIASLTKLMTANVVLDHEVPMSAIADVRNADNVGGARLYVEDGDTFSVEDLFYATLVASANNAANALSRTAGLTPAQFIAEMNQNAVNLGLTKTQYVDPTGIELGNVSTAREMARIVRTVFARDEIRPFISTVSKYINVISQGTTKKMTNTNWMLWKPEYDDLYVTGGKTGYLIESGWNVAVTLKPMGGDDDKELLIIVFGAESRGDSFIDANKLADWAWETFEWQKQN